MAYHSCKYFARFPCMKGLLELIVLWKVIEQYELLHSQWICTIFCRACKCNQLYLFRKIIPPHYFSLTSSMGSIFPGIFILTCCMVQHLTYFSHQNINHMYYLWFEGQCALSTHTPYCWSCILINVPILKPCLIV